MMLRLLYLVVQTWRVHLGGDFVSADRLRQQGTPGQPPEYLVPTSMAHYLQRVGCGFRVSIPSGGLR
jgi:hypothetical protein